MKTPGKSFLEQLGHTISKSHDKDLERSLNHRTEKAGRVNSSLEVKALSYDHQARFINYLRELVAEGMQQEFPDPILLETLKYTDRILEEQLELFHQRDTCIVMKEKDELVNEEIIEGDEWKQLLPDEHKPKIHQTKLEIKPRSKHDVESIRSIDERLTEIEKEIGELMKDLEKNYPDTFQKLDAFEENFYENRTN